MWKRGSTQRYQFAFLSRLVVIILMYLKQFDQNKTPIYPMIYSCWYVLVFELTHFFSVFLCVPLCISVTIHICMVHVLVSQDDHHRWGSSNSYCAVRVRIFRMKSLNTIANFVCTVMLNSCFTSLLVKLLTIL